MSELVLIGGLLLIGLAGTVYVIRDLRVILKDLREEQRGP